VPSDDGVEYLSPNPVHPLVIAAPQPRIADAFETRLLPKALFPVLQGVGLRAWGLGG
jgi:hypothetical protein